MARRYNFQINSKRNIKEFTQPLAQLSSERRQRVVLNGHVSTWTNVTAAVPQSSILGPLLFLSYINYLSEGFSTNAKLFADDASLFSVIHDSQT